MAKLKISELTKTSNASPTDLLYIVQGGVSKSVTVANLVSRLATLIVGNSITFSGLYVSSVNGLGPDEITLTTLNINEQGNLYYTDERARSAISVTGSGSYDTANGIIDIRGGVTSVNGQTGNVVISGLGVESVNGQTGNVTVAGYEIANVIADLTAESTLEFGNLLPKTSLQYNLGSPTRRWKTLYLAPQTLDFGGGVTIGAGETGIT